MTAPPSADAERLRAALAGRYVVQREIGHGGMAVVYLARDEKLDREVALKVLRPELAAVLGTERFVREIRITAALHHPHILPLHDSGDAAGQPFYTMPYLAGETLRERLVREGQLGVVDAVALAREIADALSYAHGQGVIHRDIKPENILLADGHAVVADFGVARAVEVAGGEQLTNTGLAIGTPSYMSPEQASGGGRLDGRCDVYSLGCVLYEMLAGEPPFTGRTAQAIIARHLQDRPPSLQVLRPTVTGGLLRVVETALAKVPADRFATAAEFGEALRAIAEGREPSLRLLVVRRHPARTGLVVAGAVAAVFAGWWLLAPAAPPLDDNRVLVFPILAPDEPPGGPLGQAIAAYVGYALEGSEPLRWEEDRDRVRAGEASAPTVPAMRVRSRRRGAAWFIDGTMLRADSVTVLLRLHSVRGDSVVGRAGRTGPRGASAARLAALAVGDLLPRLLAPGRAVDVTPLAERDPAAIANFLQGEREYAAAEFARALTHYRTAVAGDSLFALAAVKGAQAASWLDDMAQARELIAAALRSGTLLPRRYAVFAEGLRHYLDGRADSAVSRLRAATDLAPEWSEAWMGLGEVYRHLVPSDPRPDTLAESAFRLAQARDPGFAPPLFHLAELALRAGDLRAAEAHARGFRATSRDSALQGLLDLMLEGARGRLDSAAWARRVRARPTDALDAATTLTVAPRFAPSGELGLRAVLAEDSAGPNARFAALVALQSRLVATGRDDELRALLASPAAGPGGRFLFVSDAAARPTLVPDAESVVRSLGADHGAMRTSWLRLLGVWHAVRGHADTARAVAAMLAVRADTSRQPQDRLSADLVAAHANLAGGDTAGAIRLFAALHPVAPRPELSWGSWQALGLERLTLARLLAARRDAAGALRVADALDSPVPAVYPIYQRASLELRAHVAEAAGFTAQARAYRARLKSL